MTKAEVVKGLKEAIQTLLLSEYDHSDEIAAIRAAIRFLEGARKKSLKGLKSHGV